MTLQDHPRLRALLGLVLVVSLLVTALAAIVHFFVVDWQTYIVPEGFRGPAIVVFDEPGAPEPERRWWSTVYRIPESGILFVGTPAVYGFVRDRYYFQSADGTLQPIPRRAERDIVQALWVQVGRGPYTLEGTRVPIAYRGFIVGTIEPRPSDPYAELVERAARLRLEAMRDAGRIEATPRGGDGR